MSWKRGPWAYRIPISACVKVDPPGGPIADPAAFAQRAGAASWLYLNGEEFAAMDGGMSYADVQAAVPESANIIADPPRPFDMEVAR